MSLTLSAIPGFTEVADTSFNAGNSASDADMKSLNGDAKFAAVRNEQFWGFYRNGETVALPVSPADGYTYARNELLYLAMWYWTGAATGACNGTQVPPAQGSTSGGGEVLQSSALVDQGTGLVTTRVDYYDGHTHTTNDGILMVITFAQRLR